MSELLSFDQTTPAEGSVRLLVDMRLILVTAPCDAVNIYATLLGWAVKLASLSSMI